MKPIMSQTADTMRDKPLKSAIELRACFLLQTVFSNLGILSSLLRFP